MICGGHKLVFENFGGPRTFIVKIITPCPIIRLTSLKKTNNYTVQNNVVNVSSLGEFTFKKCLKKWRFYNALTVYEYTSLHRVECVSYNDYSKYFQSDADDVDASRVVLHNDSSKYVHVFPSHWIRYEKVVGGSFCWTQGKYLVEPRLLNIWARGLSIWLDFVSPSIARDLV